MGKFVFKRHRSGEKSDLILFEYKEDLWFEINEAGGELSLFAVNESDEENDQYVLVHLKKDEVRKLAGILQYFADIGELPANFEALQS